MEPGSHGDRRTQRVPHVAISHATSECQAEYAREEAKEYRAFQSEHIYDRLVG